MAKSNKKLNKIYMDYAASVEANPSSIHEYGVKAKIKLNNARKEVANTLSAKGEEIIFTSCGTESNNLAIQGSVFAWQGKELPHIVITDIEHSSVLDTCRMLELRKLAEISIVGVEANGIVDPKKILKEIKKNTVLVSVMYANNEIGTIQPIKEIAKEIRHWNKKNKKRKVFEWSGRERDPENRGPEKTLPFCVFFHTDGVQAANYLDLNVEKLGVDLLTLSGSKIEGAGRIGVLYKKRTATLANIFGGGDQEMGLRPGTENWAEILKFSKALKSVQSIKEKESKRLTQLRDYFLGKLRKFDFILNGDLKNRLPNNINITFPKIPSDLLVIELSAKGIMASSKSACKSSSKEGSYVIKAINPDIDSETGGLRFSLGRTTTKKDIDYTIESLSKILQKLKKWYD